MKPFKTIPSIALIALLLIMLASLQCKSKQNQTNKNKEEWQARAAKTEFWHFNDSDYLEALEPMSEEAMTPGMTKTANIEDFKYNRLVYGVGLERLKKSSQVIDKQIVLNLKNAKEANMSKDLYDYLIRFFEETNRDLRNNILDIIYNADGSFDIEVLKIRTIKINKLTGKQDTIYTKTKR